MTLYRTLADEKPANFDINVDYSDRAFELGAPAGIGKNIGTFVIQGLKRHTSANGETHVPQSTTEPYKALFKIKTRLDGNGIFSIESAYQQEEFMVPVVEEKKPEEEKKDEKKEEKEEAAKEETPVESEPKTKKTIRKFELKVLPKTPSLLLSQLQQLQQLELEMEASDKLVIDTAEARNALEEYVYETRSKLEMAWSEFIADESRATFSKALNGIEEWLYTEEGESATKSVYVEHLNTLKKTGEPVAFRFRESENRPAAEKGFRDYVNHVIISVKSEDGRFDHIAPEELASVLKDCQAAADWLNDSIAKQNETAKFEDPVVSCEEIKKKKEVCVQV